MKRHRPAQKMNGIAPFRVMDILARAKNLEALGKDVIHMEVGEPDFPAPPAVLAAAQKALKSGFTHYTPAAGLTALREAIATYYQTRFALDIDPQRIVITPGASGALQLVLGVLLDMGDEVLLQDPGYPCNRHMVMLYGGQSRTLPTGPHGFDATLASSAVTENTRAMLLASPANPTGEVIDLLDLKQLYQFLMQSDNKCLIVDEIYQGLQYDSEINTALSLGEEGLFVINSFSKFFGMTGFRLGWMVVPGNFAEPVERLAQNLFLAPSTIAQYAALAAFSEKNMALLEARRAIFEQRRDVLYSELRSLGFTLDSTPSGAFYIYAGIQGLAESGDQLASGLLQESSVAITPGNDFGFAGTDQHVRFAYTTDLSRIEQGIERIARYLSHGR